MLAHHLTVHGWSIPVPTQFLCLIPQSVHLVSSLPSQVQELDLSSLQSVRRFAEAWRAARRPLHVLVNNAGIFAMSAVRFSFLESWKVCSSYAVSRVAWLCTERNFANSLVHQCPLKSALTPNCCPHSACASVSAATVSSC